MKTPDHIKYYLKASSPEALKILMFQNNVKTNMYYNYEIMFANGFWFAWYEATADKMLTEKYDTIDGRKG